MRKLDFFDDFVATLVDQSDLQPRADGESEALACDP